MVQFWVGNTIPILYRPALDGDGGVDGNNDHLTWAGLSYLAGNILLSLDYLT